jgi:hypothetical protein
MDWAGFESLASQKDEQGVWIWAHDRFAGGAAEQVLAELRSMPDVFDDKGYSPE